MSDAELPLEAARDRSPLTVERRVVAGRVTLVFAGELDMATYEDFCQALVDEADRPTRDALTLDLAAVDYTDGQTWKLIASAGRQLTAAGRSLTVRLAPGGQPERVCRLLKLTRLLALP